MRRALVGALVLVACLTTDRRLMAQGAARSGQLRPADIIVSDARVQQLEDWLKAIGEHEPGNADDAATLVGSWSNAGLQSLWADAASLFALMRDIKRGLFTVHMDGQRPINLRYSSRQLDRLRLLACAAAGVYTEPICMKLRVTGSLDPALHALSRRVAAERDADGDNFVIRRAVLLHTDIATMHLAAPVEDKIERPVSAPRRVRMELSDGRGRDIQPDAIHWELAEMAIEHVKPRGALRLDPAADAMVRQWYRVTSAWLQYHVEYDMQHMEHALRMFPNDPEILFFAGCQREMFATSYIQGAVKGSSAWAGYSIEIGSAHTELRRAETYFRGALARSPDHAEAHLRLGRTLALLDRHAEAADHLRLALATLTETHLQYYGHLFLGASEEALRRYDDAQAEFERASSLFPQAQSPYLALSELARRRGDRAGALRAAERLFALSSSANEEREDPFWSYHLAQARNADDDLDALRKPFSTERPR